MEYFYTKLPVATVSEMINAFKSGYFLVKMRNDDAKEMYKELYNTDHTADKFTQYAYCYLVFKTKDTSNYNYALSLLTLLTMDGFAPAYNLIGNAYYYGTGYNVNKESALHYYMKGHNANFMIATVNCALHYLDLKDYANFKKYLEIGVSKGYPVAYYIKAEALLYGANGYDQNELTAAYLLKKGVDLGEEKCQYLLGVCHDGGYGCTKIDHHAALKLYEQAAEYEHSNSMLAAANHYFSGKYIPQNLYKAFYYYEKASNLGNKTAMAMNGMLYMEGFGCTKNPEKGIELIRKSAAAGNELGIKFLNGLNK